MITIACLRIGNQLPMACGTLARLFGEQAAVGQTARLSLNIAPGCEPHGSLGAQLKLGSQNAPGNQKTKPNPPSIQEVFAC